MLKIIQLILLLILFFIPVAIIKFLPNKYGRGIHRLFYKIICKILNIKVTVHGDISKKEPVLFVSNHISYLDILVLGAALPGSFISKAEVGSWPLIGWIAWLNGTVLIERKKSAAGGHLQKLEESFKNGKNLILFAEGTTGDGMKILPFKSSLFKIAETVDLTIQPIKIDYSRINGLPVHRNERSKIAWIGEMDLVPHVKDLFSMGVIHVEVNVLEPIGKTTDRKKIAVDCHNKIAS